MSCIQCGRRCDSDLCERCAEDFCVTDERTDQEAYEAWEHETREIPT